MKPKILTYVPPSKKSKQYRRRRWPYISADLKWMALWMVLLVAVVVIVSVVDGKMA